MIFGTGGQFGSSPYSNPQMGQLGGTTPPPPGGDRWEFGGPNQQPQATGQGGPWGGFGGGGGAPGQGSNWYNPNSPMSQWQDQYAPDESAWVGNTPGRQGQTLSYNPRTGQMEYVDSTEGLATGNQTGQLSWIDPVTGQRTINPQELERMMGGFGGGGGQGGGYQYQGYGGGQVTPGEGYGGFDYESIGSGIDPSAVIAAQEYKLQEAMEGDMARAGGRAGASGFAMSTPYANQLGEAARSASMDRNALTMQYQYDAAQAQAQRDSAQQQQAAQLDFGGWQTGYGGDLQAQMFNQQQGFQENQMQNQYGFANWQNQQNQQNQQSNMNQQLMAQLMGGLF